MRLQSHTNRIVDDYRGYTLIEVLIALAIFTIGILAIGSLQFWNVRNSATANSTTAAINLARAQLEALKNASDVTGLIDNCNPDNPVDENGDPGGIYTVCWDEENPLGSSTARQVEVSVNWWHQGKNRSIVLTTITRGNGT